MVYTIRKKISTIIIGILIVGVSLFLWIHNKQYTRIHLILPHFIIASEKLDLIRSQLAKDIGTTTPTIIIISPDHFDTYKSNKLIYDTSITNLCIQGYCHQTQGAFIPKSSFPVTNTTLILPDHGIGAHLRFIQQRIPQAKVIPILLQGRSIENIDNIINTLDSISDQQDTIIIGSVDWSHYVPEPWATLHDYTTRSILSSHDPHREDWKKLDVDCPSCLRTIDQLAQHHQQKPELLWRDSSALLFGTTGLDNTSRGAIRYRPSQEIISLQDSLLTGITLLVGGDVIYDRGVSKKLATLTLLQQHFRDWYQLHDISQSPRFTFHKWGAGIDIMMVNLETPLYASGTTCYPNNKPYSFCSHERILEALSEIGVTTISFANNHRFDAGTQQYILSKDIIKQHNMEVVSDDEFITTTLRGIPLAIHAYDFTTSDKETKVKKACHDIQDATKKGYKVIASLHRGEEYQTTPSIRQQKTAKQLIQCGVKAIIGHHPHVVQTIEYIEHVPVIYSVGNFLMDQGFSPETRTGMIVGMLIPLSGNISLFTGSVDAVP